MTNDELARELVGYMEDKLERLERENKILRSELKYRLSAEYWNFSHDMSIEEADRLAERDIVHLIAHNEGAE